MKFELPSVILNKTQLIDLSNFFREISQGSVLAGIGASFIEPFAGISIHFKLMVIAVTSLYYSVYLLKDKKGD